MGIRDVAEAAGVSITTVSHALNRKGRLPAETREHVQAVAERLGYRPNVNARNLAGGRSGLLALAMSRIEDPAFQLGDFDYYGALVGGATSAAIDRGYALAVAPAADAEKTLHKVSAEGAIVVDPVPGDRSVQYLRQTATPFVTTGRPLDAADGGYWVDNDHEDGLRRMFDHLARADSERIALVTPLDFKNSYVDDTLGAYRKWCSDQGFPEMIANAAAMTEEAGYEAAISFLDSPEPPDAIFATIDLLAIGVLHAARQRGIPVPGELQVAASHDSRAAQMARPPLTSLSVNPGEIGRHAVEMLINLVEEIEVDDDHVIVPTQVLARGSTRGT